MGKLVYNERSWAIDLISEINKWCSTRNIVINRAGGESTLKKDKKRFFPDVLLYGDEVSGLVLQGWELKMPDVQITDKEFFDNAKKKAEIMNLKSFVLWNVSEANLYRINDDGTCEIIKTWNELSYIKKREEVETHRNEWIKMLHQILDDLNYYFNRGDIISSKVANSITGEGITNFILEHTKLMADNLKKESISNGKLNDSITIWWETAKSEYLDYEEPWEPLAKLVLTSWTNRLTFAHILKKYYSSSNIIDNICEDISIEDAISILNKIGKQTGYANVLQSQLGEEFLPSLTWEALKQLNELLINSRIEKIDNRYMQVIISNVVKRSIRKIYGQFTTPNELAAFIVSLVVTDKTKNMIDPCCGTGTIAKECFEWKVVSGVKEEDALATTFASDKLSYPLQLATTSLTSPNTINQVINVFNKDVIDLAVGLELELYSTQENQYIETFLPQMGYIISNLPFVQQEDIRKLNPKIKSKVNSKISNILNKEVEINSRADLYAYLPFILWQLLEDDGKLAIITSNSWLATDWGTQFYELLNEFYNIDYVIASNNGRWFSNAEVVTTIMVLQKRSLEAIKSGSRDDSEITKYILLNEKIEDIATNDDGKIDYNALNVLSTNIRNEIPDDRFSLSKYTKKEIYDILNLGLSKNALFVNVGWVTNINNKVVKLDNIFKIARGERRGWDPLFFPSTANSIENEYIRPVLKTSREIESYLASPNSIAFCCLDSLEVLLEKGNHGAYRWIKSFENSKNNVGKPLPEVLKRPNIFWYSMKPDTVAELCISINPGDRLFFARLEEAAFVNQRLMRFLRKSEEYDVELLSALLNSILGLFYIEALGFGRGQGALDLTPTNFKKKGYMLDPRKLTEKDKSDILGKFKRLESRKVLPILDELNQSDRIEFDKAVLQCYGLEGYYSSIKSSLVELYNIRIAVKK